MSPALAIRSQISTIRVHNILSLTFLIVRIEYTNAKSLDNLHALRLKLAPGSSPPQLYRRDLLHLGSFLEILHQVLLLFSTLPFRFIIPGLPLSTQDI